MTKQEGAYWCASLTTSFTRITELKELLDTALARVEPPTPESLVDRLQVMDSLKAMLDGILEDINMAQLMLAEAPKGESN